MRALIFLKFFRMNTVLKNITTIAEEPVNLNSPEDRMCVIGDSNGRDFWKTFSDDSEFHKYKLDVNAVGGRKTSDLKHLVRYAQRYKYVIVFLGTNDLNSVVSEENILNCIQDFINQLLKSPQQEVRIVGLFSRKDIKKDAVHSFKNKLKERFSAEFFPCKFGQRKPFPWSMSLSLQCSGSLRLEAVTSIYKF